MTQYHIRTLSEALTRLREHADLSAAAGHMAENAEHIQAELARTTLDEIGAFSESRIPDLLGQSSAHGAAHTDELIRLLAGGRVGEFDFVRDHARLRSEQHFPLEATLHAYRCGHKVFSRWLRAAVVGRDGPVTNPHTNAELVAAVADFSLEYTDAISTICTESYLAQTLLMFDLASDRRSELHGILLHGYDESDRRVTKILGEAGYLKDRQTFCLVVARSVVPTEMLTVERARRLADAVDQAFRSTTIKRLIDIRDNKVVAILSDASRLSGWTAPAHPLSERIAAHLKALGNAALAGVSREVGATSLLPQAYREALLALELADPARRVLRVADLTLREVLLQTADSEVQRALPSWAETFLAADANANGALLATLRAYADADMNVLKAGARLGVHANTIYSRLQKVADVTGLNARSYHALTELLLVADCAPGSARAEKARGEKSVH